METHWSQEHHQTIGLVYTVYKDIRLIVSNEILCLHRKWNDGELPKFNVITTVI